LGYTVSFFSILLFGLGFGLEKFFGNFLNFDFRQRGSGCGKSGKKVSGLLKIMGKVSVAILRRSVFHGANLNLCKLISEILVWRHKIAWQIKLPGRVVFYLWVNP
jgi:hypothetical protein